MHRLNRKWITAIIVMSLMGVLPAVPASAVVNPADSVFISEIHYDNAGADVGEAIEIFGPAGTDLTGWTIVLYNGTGGAVYNTLTIPTPIPDSGGIFTPTGYGVVVINLPSNGLQNGSPDGLALVDDTGTLRQFLSYEGVFAGVGGAADGVTSTDIGVSEPSDTPVGYSLQLAGTGVCYGNLTWTAAAANTFGAVAPIVPDAAVACGDTGGGDGPPPVRFSELHYDNSSTDINEAIEVYGPAGTDLTGWSVVLYNGNGGAPYSTTALTGTIPDLAAGAGVVTVDYPSNGIQNGAPDGMALVDAGGTLVEFLSYEGTFTGVGGAADGITSTDIGVEEGGATLVDQSLQRDADGAWDGPFCNSFGVINETSPETTCPIPAVEAMIHDVQGNGAASPMVGARVIIEGVVVGDEEGPAPALRGFFVQEEDSDADADPATSEGIFVFNFNNDDVNLGDVVRVEGTVEERFGNTQLTDFVVVEVLDVAPRVATPATVNFPVVRISDLEAFEGMAATFPQELVISEYFNYDRFGEIVVALPVDGQDRPNTPTAVFGADTPEAAALADLNLRSRITVDDGNSFQNPDNPIHPINRQLFTLDNTFRGGDQVAGLTGPILYSFNLYRVLPYAEGGYDTYTKSVRPAAPDDVGGDLTVASFNALNYFVTIDDGVNDVCGPNQTLECRGADNAGELARQRVKLLNALEGIDGDVVGLIEIENRFGVEPLADIVSGLNDRLGAGTYAYVAAGADSVVGSDAIKVGVIYKPASVTPVGDVAILETPEFLDPNNTGSEKNRAAVAVTFMENSSGEVFSVTVNHLKSKGSGCGAGDDHPLAGSCNTTRTLAAGLLVDWIATNPTGIADDDWLIIGDLNSYDQEDPIAALQADGYTDLVGAYQGPFAYSYGFDGQFGYLDYSMSSPSATAQVTGATVWNLNSDEPDILDYDTSFKSNYQDTLFEPDNAFRSSDHDAVLVGLDLDGLDPVVTATPNILWTPNHKLRNVVVSATDATVGALDELIVNVTSSEADSGYDAEDVPNDIQIVDNDEVMLRAERYSIEGRTYTIYVMVSGDGQVAFDSVTVFVAHDQRGTSRR